MAGNLFAGIPANSSAELVEVLARSERVRIERIVSHGHCSPRGFWYDQKENEWVVLLSGSAGIAWEGDREVTVLRPGDYLEIPARTKHRVEWTEADRETVWLAVFY